MITPTIFNSDERGMVDDEDDCQMVISPMERYSDHSLVNLPSEIIHLICQYLQSHDLFYSLFALSRHWYESLAMYPTIFLRRCKNAEGAIQVLRNRFKDLRFLNLSGLQLYDENGCKTDSSNTILKVLRDSMREGCTKLNYFRMANCLTSPKQVKVDKPQKTEELTLDEYDMVGDGNNWIAEPAGNGYGEEVIIEVSPKFIETVVFEMMGQIKKIQVEDIIDPYDANCNAQPKEVSFYISRCKNISTEAFESLGRNPRFCSSVTKMMLEWDVGVNSQSICVMSQYFTNITSLSIANCVNIDSAGFEAISKMTGIHTLTLVGTTIRDGDLITISKLPNLKSIDLTGCKNTVQSEETIVQFLTNCPQMEELFLVDCNLTDWTLHIIKEKLKNLKFLDISWNVDFTDEGMFNILGELPNLESFNITTGAKIELAILLKDDNSLLASSEDVGKDLYTPLLPKLTKLNLSMRNYQCNESIQAVLRNAPNLVSLQLSGCSRLTDDSFSNINPKIYPLRKLKEVHLMRCSWLTDESLNKLMPLCISSLENLFLQRSKFSKQKIDEWKYKLENIKKIGYPKR